MSKQPADRTITAEECREERFQMRNELREDIGNIRKALNEGFKAVHARLDQVLAGPMYQPANRTLTIKLHLVTGAIGGAIGGTLLYFLLWYLQSRGPIQ